MKKVCLLTVLSWMLVAQVRAQLIVNAADASSNKLKDIVEGLVGHGVTVSNITCNLPPSSDIYGTFTESSDQLGISKGLLMTSGSIYNSPGPNNDPSITSVNHTGGDPDLFNLVNLGKKKKESVHDACVIEFDINTSSSEISFNYIFGSEEYPVFVGSKYNDIFAFFISGPDIYGEQNIALLPGTNVPVSINTVNAGSNSGYFVNNGDGSFGGGPIVQYNGYTVKLKAVARVTPCKTYHLKLAIADVGDYQYDSGVFIEAGSLSGSDALMIGSLLAPDSLSLCSSELPITLRGGKNTLPHYTWFQDGVQIAAENKYQDANTAGWYNVIAYRDSQCYWKDSIKIKIKQDFTLRVADTGVCEGDHVTLNVLPLDGDPNSYTYKWSPGTYLSSRTIANPVSTPLDDIHYSVTISNGGCNHNQKVDVAVLKPIHLQPNTHFSGCINQPIQLQESGADKYLWTPGIYLNDSTIANPLATISTDRTFQVKGYNACFIDSTNVDVSVSSLPPVSAYGDTTICYGGTASLSSDYFIQYQYSWSPSNTLSDANIFDPTASPNKSKEYILSVDNSGCIKKDTVHVEVREEVKAFIVMPVKYGQIPWNVKLRNFSTGGDDFTWYFSGFPSTKVKDPSILIQEEDYYTIVLEVKNSAGCIDYDTITLKAYNLFIPNLITPNGDGKNDEFKITGLGDQFELEIFNRWGDRVYQKSNYRNEWTGEGLSDGVYYFLIKDPTYDKEYKGWVQLMR